MHEAALHPGPYHLHQVGCLWGVPGRRGSGEGSGGRRAILHGAVVDPTGFRSSSCSSSSPSRAPHAADAESVERLHPLPGTRILGTRNATNHDGHTPHPRGSVAGDLVQEG